MGIREWPTWWSWEIELSPHLLKRMVDREFTEVDLRRMLEHARRLLEDAVEGRWLVETRHSGRNWEVVVEPDFDLQRVLIITAYPVW